MKYGLLIIIWLWIIQPVCAQKKATGNQYDEEWQNKLQHLTQQLGWQTPELKEGDYEVRIWHQYGLVKGTAHGAYVIRKIGTRVSLDGYRIRYSEKGRPRAKHYRPNTNVSLALWTKLVDSHLLVLPTWSDVQIRYYASFPKDSTWNEISSDGTVTVKARRLPGRMAISDGESYGFSIFSHDESRFYTYSSPSLYLKTYTDIPELRDVTGILKELDSLF